MYLKKHDFADAIRGMDKQITVLKAESAKIGPELIVCRNRNGRLTFSEKLAKKEKGITQDKQRVIQLIRKDYIYQHLKILQKNCDAVKYCYDNYADIIPEEIAAAVSARHPSIPTNLILSPPADTWSTKSYEKNPFHPEHLQYYTNGGVVVRSKSEREIGNTLEAMGISYRYDVKIVCGEQIYYADFVIKRPDGSILIWEHFGREHDKVYMAKNCVRIQDYISLGYRPWDNLIWTLDSDIKDSHNIRRIIKRFILTTV